jgi:hypothetical protein
MCASVASRRIEWRLFLAAWLAYAFFQQGGGWNQNVRFAMARSVVEQGSLSIDSFLFYSSAEPTGDGQRLVRTPIVDGGFRLRGREFALAWQDDASLPVRGYRGDAELTPVGRVAATSDLAFAGGRFYPNKAPGTALLAVPGYFVIYHVERLVGLDPDDWWVLTVNGWLTTALSVGLISAAGCVLFLRVALRLWGGRYSDATWATLAFGFATLFFPYATLLFEHNVVAVLLLGAWYLLLRSRAPPGSGTLRLPFLAGVAAGYAAISTYIAAVPVLLLGVYLLLGSGRRSSGLGFGLGLAGPLLLVCSYNWSCFGTPFTTSYHFQNPEFQQAGAFLEVLSWPRLERLLAILISPYRGLFFSSPVLLMGVAGWVALWREGRRTEVLLCGSMVGFFLLFNASFNAWHGGWGVGPRYLIPALPFLALPMTVGFGRYFRTTLVLATLSALTMLCFTAVDVQSPVGSASIARFPDREVALREPLTEYALPILLTGKAWPILEAQIEATLRSAERSLLASGTSAEERALRRAQLRERLEQSVERGDPELALSLWSGPVSANPIGIYEGWLGHVFPMGSPEMRWNSFNAGELILPGVWSLSVLMIAWLPLVGSALIVARSLQRCRPDRVVERPPR